MSRQTLEERFWSKVNRASGQGPKGNCLFWIGACGANGNYGQIVREGVVERAHRVAYELHHDVRLKPVCEGGPLVCHSCDQPRCINHEHLFLGSDADNAQDMVRKGRQGPRRVARGELNNQARLRPDQVFAIRRDGRSQPEIAKSFAIAKSMVSMIKTRKRWPHLPEEVLTND